MVAYNGLRISSWILIVVGVLFYVTSVAGLFWPKASPWDDTGLYSMTVVLIGMGVGGLLLRSAKLHPRPGA